MLCHLRQIDLITSHFSCFNLFFLTFKTSRHSYSYENHLPYSCCWRIFQLKKVSLKISWATFPMIQWRSTRLTDGVVFFTLSKLVVWRYGRSYSGKRTLWNVVTGSKLFWLAASCRIDCWLDGMQIRRASLWMQRALQCIFHLCHGMTFSINSIIMHLGICHIFA